MPPRSDRVGELLSGARRNLREITTPEGVTIEVEVASHGERLAAFAIDLVFWLTATALLYGGILLMLLHGVPNAVAITAILFVAFVVRNLYFVYFELNWQGRTPGKRLCGLRVIDRQGGPLLPGAIVARNLTREVEVFLPLGILISLDVAPGSAFWQSLAGLGWIVLIAGIPLFNRDHLRAGDLLGGTMVVAMPRRTLLADLAAASQAYAFTPQQLGAYGAFELQVLEELLRRPQGVEADRLLADVCGKICRKIGWAAPIPPQEVRRFLHAFYSAERADLERARLFGRHREDKSSGAAPPAGQVS